MLLCIFLFLWIYIKSLNRHFDHMNKVVECFLLLNWQSNHQTADIRSCVCSIFCWFLVLQMKNWNFKNGCAVHFWLVCKLAPLAERLKRACIGNCKQTTYWIVSIFCFSTQLVIRNEECWEAKKIETYVIAFHDTSLLMSFAVKCGFHSEYVEVIFSLQLIIRFSTRYTYSITSCHGKHSLSGMIYAPLIANHSIFIQMFESALQYIEAFWVEVWIQDGSCFPQYFSMLFPCLKCVQALYSFLIISDQVQIKNINRVNITPKHFGETDMANTLKNLHLQLME